MHPIQKFLLLVVIICLTERTHAQVPQPVCERSQQQWFDLAQGDAEIRHVDHGCYQICVSSLVPGVSYTFNQSVIAVQSQTPEQVPQHEAIRGSSDPCDPLKVALEKPPSKETEISAWISKMDKLAEDCFGGAKLVNEKIQETRHCFAPSNVTRRSGVEAGVKRPNGKEWKFQLLPPERKLWYTSYGIQAFPSEDERYFSASVDPLADGTPQFEIRRESVDSKDYDADPLILFTRLWGDGEKTARVGISAGVGYDSDDLSFVLGPSIAFGDFLFVTGGLAFHPQERLEGSFHVGQKVTTNLTESALVDDTHNFNGFLSVTLAFGKNPINAGDSTNNKPPPSNANQKGDKNQEGSANND